MATTIRTVYVSIEDLGRLLGFTVVEEYQIRPDEPCLRVNPLTTRFLVFRGLSKHNGRPK